MNPIPILSSLSILSILSFGLLAGPLEQQGVGVDAGRYASGDYAPGAFAYGGGYPNEGHRPSTGALPGERARGGRLWVPVPPPPAEGWRQGPWRADAHADYPPAGPGAGLYEYLRSPPANDAPAGSGRYGYPAITGPAEGRGPAGRYRFRGDDSADARGDGGGLWHRGYRFRPLTAQEVERWNAGPRWRPGGSGQRPAMPEPPAAAPDETYGYRTEGWFGRYFGGPGR